VTQIIIVSGTAWNVPANWNNAANSIEGIGAGGNGTSTTIGASGGGGGGGEYHKVTNATFTVSSTVDINIPSGGAGSAADGTWIKDGANQAHRGP
jgi:hypothetical protein